MNDENQHEKTAVPLDQTSVSNVTVFVSDRAEITRLISVQGLRPGVQEITVMGLTSKADEDSIRVKAAPGCRRSKLLEVSFEVHTKADEAGEGGRSAIDAKRSELKELQAKLTETLDALGREVANKELIDTYVRGMLAPYRDSKLTQPPPVGEKLSSVRELLAFHASAAAEHSAARLRLEVEVAALRAKVEAVEEALRRLFAPARPRTKSSRDVHVLVDVETAAGVAAKGGDAAGEPPLLLLLTYMVSSASWVPSYDIRVETCQGSEPDMSITYLGLVSNASGEDWPACRLRLSTAQPSKGGMPAAPPRRRVGWQEEAFGGGGHFGPPGCPPRGREAHMRRDACGAAPMQPPMQAYMAYPNAMLERELSVDALEVMDAMDGSGEMAATASVSDSAGGAATFSVERPCTIESDARPHRVTIAILSFKPTLLFFATPLLEEAAYMQVRARNASSFPLLASRKVACFLDGSFVCTTHLKDVMPSEEFTTFGKLIISPCPYSYSGVLLVLIY